MFIKISNVYKEVMSLKSFLIGSPLVTRHETRERLTKLIGLAILASDALSSLAYATEEMLRSLVLAGSSLLSYSTSLSLVIALLIATVAVSYYQVIQRYPGGGGSYAVAKEHLGTQASLITGASLLIDYVLTVAVSVVSGVAALTSAYHFLYPYRMPLCYLCILLLTLGNLRGIRESGKYFSLPIYIFISSLALLLFLGIHHSLQTPPLPFPTLQRATTLSAWWILLRAFSTGCVALTGIESVANGVTAFKPPEARNAGVTLIWMAGMLGTFFIGITYLSRYFGLVPLSQETILSQLGHRIFGDNLFYYLLQLFTYAVLILAANTAYAGFPRLSSIMAYDGYLPKQLSTRGDRLVFSNGILLLSGTALFLMWIFEGDIDALVPLYTVGVFSAFTFSQLGLAKNWLKTKEHGWKRKLCINGVGGLATGTVLLIVGTTKFLHGAWMVFVAIPLLVFLMHRVHRHYRQIQAQLDPSGTLPLTTFTNTLVLLPISGANQSSLNALAYAQLISKEVHVVYVAVNPEESESVKKNWEKCGKGIPLHVLDSPHRSLIEPFMTYLDELKKGREESIITVVLPSVVPQKWWQQILHNQSAILLRWLLFFKPKVVTVTVPTFLDERFHASPS